MRKEVELNKHTCATHGCGITFWLEEGYEDRRRADKGGFYCPNGHSHVYGGDTEEQRLRKIIASKNSTIYGLESDLRKAKQKRKTNGK